MSAKSVVAVVVTYNRMTLLLQCLTHLRAQTHKPDVIVIVDNASDDGTTEALQQQGFLDAEDVHYKRLNENLGGAHGFAEGIRYANEIHAQWIWLMDDDSLPSEHALEALMHASRDIEGFSGERPSILASFVRWTDGSAHPMNLPVIRRVKEIEFFSVLDRCHILPIRSTSFVSCLINGDIARRERLPIAKYFIWNDDVEYTSRILRFRNGYLVPSSIVTHATKKKYTSSVEIGDRFFFEVRNKIWLVCRSDALTFREKFRFTKSLLGNIARYIYGNKLSAHSFLIVLKGLKASFYSPY